MARVYAAGVSVSRELVKQGDCRVYPRYAKDEVLFKLQDGAKADRNGFWALQEKERMPPWEWSSDSKLLEESLRKHKSLIF